MRARRSTQKPVYIQENCYISSHEQEATRREEQSHSAAAIKEEGVSIPSRQGRPDRFERESCPWP
jgi:hypothetical protein